MFVKQVCEKHDWSQVLKHFGAHDFVHTFDFHVASQCNGEGTPVMYVALDGAGQPIACWPILKRRVPGTDYFDLTSVYGYGGPLFGDGVAISAAVDSIWESMRQSGAVSLFSRMHPLFVEKITNESQRGHLMSEVVVIDVHQTSDVLSLYRGSHRREIQNARKFGVKVTIDDKCQDLESFFKIYSDSMMYLNASEKYYFSESYFESLKDSSDFNTMILFAELDGKKISASMFIVTGVVMQYYLSGTVGEFRKLAPSKAIIARAHEWAVEFGINKIVLGGGVGSSRDSLFKFKAGFSEITKPFYVVKKIFRKTEYEELCDEKNIDPSRTAFFPAYRA